MFISEHNCNSQSRCVSHTQSCHFQPSLQTAGDNLHIKLHACGVAVQLPLILNPGTKQV